MIVGGYTLHLYCDGRGCLTNYPHGRGEDARYVAVEFSGETGQECRKDAKKAGWIINARNGTCLCPKCIEAGNPIEVSSGEPIESHENIG